MKFYGRESLRSVEGYVPGEQPKESGFIKLNTNENPYPPSPKVIAALQTLNTTDLRKYPDPMATGLRKACAKAYGAPNENWIIMGNGMDEILAMAIRAFVDPGDRVIAPYPTYTLYEVLCKLHGCTLDYIDLAEDFQLVTKFFDEQGKFCFLARPNAPTGVAFPKEDVRRYCENFEGIVLIDEAYVDFSDDHCLDFPIQFPNVIIARTLSKSYSLAGLRIGVAMAQPALIHELVKVKDSYNLNTFSQVAGIAAIEDSAYMRQNAEQVRRSRTRLRNALLSLGFVVPESGSNFLLAQWDGVPNAATIFNQLREQRILVRYFNQRRLENALRITVGTDKECDALVNALQGILKT